MVLVINPLIMSKVPYDPDKDLTPVEMELPPRQPDTGDHELTDGADRPRLETTVNDPQAEVADRHAEAALHGTGRPRVVACASS